VVQRAAELLPSQPEGRYNGPEHFKGWIAFSALDTSVVGPVDVRDLGKTFLGKRSPIRFPECSDDASERAPSFQVLDHERKYMAIVLIEPRDIYIGLVSA
jgi:hypothetical protein